MLKRPISRISKLVILGLIVFVVIGTIPLMLMCPRESSTQKQSRGYSEPSEPSEPVIIVPGLGVGDYTLGMSKDEVLEKLGEPESIMWNGERYTLSNLPRSCYMYFDNIAFEISDDSVKSIVVYGSLYKFKNGLRVGDPEEKVIRAFGDNFHLSESVGKAFLTYEDEGLTFEIHDKKRTVMEITVSHAKGNQSDSDAPNSGKAPALNEQSPEPITFPKTGRKPTPDEERLREFKTLPKDNKVRVTSISRGWARPHKDDKAITESVQKVQAAGMLVVCSGVERFYSKSGLACHTSIYISWVQASPSSSKALFMAGPIKNNVVPIIAEATRLLLWENHKRITTSCIKGFLLKCVIHDTLWDICETINSEVKVTIINFFGSQHYTLKQVTVFNRVCSSFGTLFADLYDWRRRSGAKKLIL